ncbi:uncharacterized protein LOC115760459 [Drosophila novamexicana]|uniref:uncharacterized protein LOC115760459 n=1 Tax=Drosophila novamexicana TaxID=47314 RepID=UPI0011E5C2CC|nr:uncharacterized protein LOC115760459 [Drosophila novamexicana]
MSHLLRRTKKSCLKLLRKISTSKQLFVQRLDEDEEYEEHEEQQEQQVEQEHISYNCSTNDKQYVCHINNTNNSPIQSVQDAAEALDVPLERQQLPSERTALDIQFDRVPYKENVRYLRHTPSNSSLDLQLEQQREWEREREQVQRERELVASQRGYSVSVGSQFDGHYHNVIIMEHQPPNDDYPIVKWDINGNSLDEEHFDLRQHWDAFDSRWRQLQSAPSGKRLGSGHSQRSSHHSSACTLETWIDDAELGNCDDAQNLLQTNKKKNTNNNNLNQCLKSF